MNESLAAKFNHVYNKLATKMSLKVKSLTAFRLVAKKLIRDNITLKKKLLENSSQLSEVLMDRILI